MRLPENQHRLVLDPARQKVTLDGIDLRLTQMPRRMLECMAQDLGRVYTHDQLMSYAKNDPTFQGMATDPAAVRRHVRQLRQELGADGKAIIITAEGGYKLCDDKHFLQVSGGAPTISNTETVVADQSPLSPTFLDRLGIHTVLLEGDGLYEYNPEDISIVWGPTSAYTLQAITNKPLRSLCNKVLQEKQRIADETDRVFYEGKLARLFDYRPTRDAGERYRQLRLRLQPTSYFTFVATNHALESSYADAARNAGLITTEVRSPTDLRNSLLANPLTVTINIIIEEPDGSEWLVLQKRNANKVMHCWQVWQSAAAGMVNLEPDSYSSVPNLVFTSAFREIAQETGLSHLDRELYFLALARETTFYEVGLLGEVRIKERRHKFLGLPADSFESEAFMTIPLTPDSVLDFLAKVGQGQSVQMTRSKISARSLPIRREDVQSGMAEFVPMALAAVILSLIHRFGANAIEEAFEVLI